MTAASALVPAPAATSAVSAVPHQTQSFPLTRALIVYLLAFLALAAPWLSGAVTIPWDAKAQFQPQLSFLAKALAHGESPFWTPNVFAGWPQIADPQSLLFSPLHLLLAWIDPQLSFRAADAVTFLALFLGGLAILLYARDRGWHPAAALVGAMAFAFGGSAAARIQHTSEILSLCYLPFAVWLLTRALERGSVRIGLAAGFAAGLMAAGRDQVALLGLYLLAAIVVDRWFARGLGELRKSVRPLAGLAIAGLVVAGPPALLTALLAADSNRPEIAYTSAVTGSLHPAHLLTFAFSDLFATNSPQVGYWGPPSAAWGSIGLILAQNMGELYAGAVPVVAIVLLGIAVGGLWARPVRAFTVALVIAILYALGRYTPAFHAFYDVLPGVSLYRRPADATFLIGTTIAILTAHVVHQFLSLPADAAAISRAQLIRAAALGVAITAAAILVAISAGKVSVAAVPILIGLGWTLAAIAALALAWRLRARPFAAALVLMVTMTADLAWNNAPNVSTGRPASFYDVLRPDTANETIALLKAKLAASAAPNRRDRVELIGIGYHWPNVSLVHGFDHVFGQNPLRLENFKEATGVGDTVAVPEQRRFSPLYPSYRSAFADLFGVRLIATGIPVEQIDRALRPGDLTFLERTKDAYIYENPRALPRVMLITDWRLADFDELIRTGWPDVDPAGTILLEHPPLLAPGSAGQAVQGRAQLVRYGNVEVVVDVDAPAGGFLLLTDVWHPWWRAEVDGVDTPLLKADVLFRAVELPPGQHRVRFAFHPVSGAIAELGAKLRGVPNR